MTYSKLLLSTGGGIISQTQQADQVENTATVLIGLGGTGVDCLAEIKKAVKERLKPDDPAALVPTYDHIRFLAVDTDQDNGSMTFFDPGEIFDIANSDIKGALQRKSTIESRREMDWLNPDVINVADIGDKGAGGFRQAGRYMIVDRSNEFLTKVKSVIRNAKREAGRASLFVHVFSGLGGGTGSGTFLDACYLIRKAIQEENAGNGKLFGYFFLPDVNLSKIPDSATLVKDYIPRNGYAAMQELDYCMRLGENGGGFTQVYKGGLQVDWKEAPVDMCHLICSTDRDRREISNAYQNAMLVTTEYIMDFLTKPTSGSQNEKNETGKGEAEKAAGESEFSITSHLANFSAQVMAADERKEKGYHLAYCVIGASCASIPMRKINTYLASKVFEIFASMRDHKPTETEIQKLAERARVSDVSNLLMEISKDASGDLAPAPEYLDWEYVRDNGDRELVDWYANQKAERMGKVERNAKGMVDEGNGGSLLNRICDQLNECARDLNRGPAYAYGMLREAAKVNNLLNIVSGLKADIEQRYEHLNYNVYVHGESRKAVYESSMKEWRAEMNNGFLGKGKAKKAFDNYVFSIEDYIRSQVELETMEKLQEVLKKLDEQLKKKAAGYYQKFARVMENLTSTFEENLRTLNEEKVKGSEVSFAVPLVTIEEIRPALDKSVDELDKEGLLRQFVDTMLSDEKAWEEENEDKISKAVKDFFINQAFGEYANRSITQFLSDKYNTTSDAEISDRLYQEYMTKLRSKSQALFPVAAHVWDDAVTSEIAYVSVPSTAQVVVDAAQQLYRNDDTFRVKKSALKDRIYIMRCSVALPIGAYANCELYEQSYFSGAQAGRHYYIGKGGSKLFNNWQELPSLIPQSLVEGHTPAKLQEILDRASAIYEEGKAAGAINDDRIRQLSEGSVEEIETAMNYVASARMKASVNTMQAKQILQDAVGKLKSTKSALSYVDTPYHMPKGSVATPKIEETIRKDYFVSSPAFHTLVKESLEKISGLDREIGKLEQEIGRLGAEEEALKSFCQALFSGIIVWDKLRVTYTREEFGISTEVELSDFKQKDRFPYAQIPLFQAYKSYQLLDEDTRSDIAQATNQKVAELDDEVVASVRSYEERFTPDFNKRVVASAQAFPEIRSEVAEFMKGANNELMALSGTLSMMGL